MTWEELWGDAPWPSRFLAFEVNTFIDVATIGRELSRWAEKAVAGLVLPAAELAELDRELVLVELRLGRELASFKRLDERSLASALEQLTAGELEEFSVTSERRGGALGLRVEAKSRRFEGVADSIAASVSEDEVGDIPVDVQERWVDSAITAARLARAATGAVMLDRALFPLEVAAVAAGRSLFHFGLREASEWLRGYCWGNFLSQGHLDKLGGKERVLAEAPCVRAVDLSLDDHQLVYLQLTEDARDASDDAYRALRSFLRPALPVFDVEQDYFGPPLRLVY